MSHAGDRLRQRIGGKPQYTPAPSHTKCAPCGKNSFANQGDAFSAALSASRGKGKPFRTYPCPVNPERFHITSRTRRVGDRFEH